MTASFKSTATPPQPVPLSAYDKWLVDPKTGGPIGIQSPKANGADLNIAPVPLTAAQIASPTAAMIADVISTYCLNVAPYTRYMSNGTTLVSLAEDASPTDTTMLGYTIVADPIGMFGTLSTVPPTMIALIVDVNMQDIIYSPWTIQNAGGVEVRGTIRVYNWP